MIPISLSIEGLFSYRDKQTIDFERLNKARLFGVFGAVGSGKSSILEAITLALFGQCERLGNNDNKNYNAMNLASQKLYVSFEFEYANQKYQYNYGNKRNSKRFDDVRSPERSAFEWVNNSWKPLPTSNAEDVLGLSYENFRRTIIIPQGKFQEFLQLEDAKRTRMLKDMFSLDRFEFDVKAKSLLDKTELELAGFAGSLLELEQYSEEAETKLKSELESVKNQGIEARKKLDLLTEEFGKLNEAQRLDNIWKEKRENYDKAKERIPELNLLSQKLKRYKDASQLFSEDLKQAKKLKLQLEESESNLTRYSAQQKEVEDLFGQFRKTIENLNKTKKEVSIWQKEKAELERLAEYKILLPKQTEWLAAIAKSQEKLNEIVTNIATNEVEERQNEQLLNQFKAKLVQKEQVNQWIYWFETKARLEKQEQDLKVVLLKIEEQLESSKQNRSDLLLKNNIKESSSLEPEITALKINLDSKTQEKDHLLTLSGLEKYASTLHDGEPCPLCGSEEHPHIINSNEAQKALADLEQAIKLQKDKIELYQQLDKQLSAIQIEIENQTTRKKETETQFNQLKNELELYETKKPMLNLGFKNANEAQVLINELNELEASYNQLNEKESARKLNQKVIIEEKDKEQQTLNQYQLELKTVETQLASSNKNWEMIHPEDFIQTDASEIKRLAFALESEQLEIADKISQLELQIKQAEQKLAMISGSYKTQTQVHESIAAEFKGTSISLEEKLADSEFSSLVEVEALLSNSFDVNQMELKINELKLIIDKAKADLEEAEQKAQLNPHYQQNWEEKNQALKLQSELLQDLIGEFKAKDFALKSAVVQREKAASIKEKVSKLETRRLYLTELRNLFKASGFVRFVSQVFLENLCKQADQRFRKLTRNQLSLELDGSLNFVVRDFLHDGQVRSVKTLSGGQTFQAALSLALALSDSFNRFNSGKGHFFFMDEGFGSLDAESLKVVFDALQELRFENRIVGVISHLEELQKEIDTYLKITNLESQGSVVSVSWEM